MCGPNSNHHHAPIGAPIGVTLNLDVMQHTHHQADLNRRWLDAAGVHCLNLMSGPGAGKTTLLARTLAALKGGLKSAVIEGDMATELDAEQLRKEDVPVVAITTGRACHLDADLVASGLQTLELDGLDLLLIENVGNLVCPAEFPLGEHDKVVLVSVTEGEDKPLKYPVMFHEADCVVITKIDLLPLLKVDLARFTAHVHQIRPGIPVLPLSAESGAGMAAWLAWLETRLGSRLATGVQLGHEPEKEKQSA